MFKYLLLSVFCVGVGFFIGAVLLPPAPIAYTQPEPTYINESELWNVVNEWRIENNLDPYKESLALCGFAEKRNKEIQTNMTHDGFFAIKDELFSSTRFTRFGENLESQWDSDSATFLNGWLKSPTHKQNLTDNFTHSCIRCDTFYCVQLFAK